MSGIILHDFDVGIQSQSASDSPLL